MKGAAVMNDLEIQYLGCLGLLARCSVALQDTPEELADETRESIEQALLDAQKIGMPIHWRRILDRIDVEVSLQRETP